MIIPQQLPIMENETLYSYIIRLAEHNCLDMDIFLNSYVWPNAGYHDKKQLRYDSFEDINVLLKSLDYIGEPLSVFNKHTIYPAIAPFIPILRQDQILNTVFGQNKHLSNVIGNVTGISTALKLCPDCINEELELYGFYYFHREHQINNVCVCHKHHKILLIYHPSKRYGYNFPIDNFKPMIEKENEADIVYANFVRYLFSMNIQGNKNRTHNVLINKVRHEFYDFKLVRDDYKTVIDFLDEKGYEHCVTSSFESDVKQILIKNRTPLSAIMMLTCAMYKGNVNDVSKDISDDLKLKEEFLHSISGYTLISEYNENGVILKHNKCGSIFYNTPQGYLNGWICPKCNTISENKMFDKLCRFASNNRYILKTEFLGFREKVTFIHRDCRKECQMTARDFLYNNSRCPCESQYTQKKIEKRLNEKGFSLVTFNGYTEQATILHIKGKHTFDINSVKTFLRHPFCRLCEKENMIRSNPELAKEIYLNRIKELVGDEYILVSNYTTQHDKVEILHNSKCGGCGKTFSVRADTILRGQRCPYCTKVLKFEEFKNLVSTLSEGNYEVEKTDSRYVYLVRNTIIGTKKLFSKNMILQELRRKTHSNLLP